MFYYSFFDDLWFLHFPKTGNRHNINISPIFSTACVHTQRISCRIQIFYSFWLQLSYRIITYDFSSSLRTKITFGISDRKTPDRVSSLRTCAPASGKVLSCSLTYIKNLINWGAYLNYKMISRNITCIHILLNIYKYICAHVSGTWILYCCMCSWLFRYDLIHFSELLFLSGTFRLYDWFNPKGTIIITVT